MNLLTRFQAEVENERKATLAVLRTLMEVEDRKYYLEVDCKDIWAFCIKHGKYSEGSAGRRINAMRLLRANEKQVAPKLATGELNLTNAAKVQTVLRLAEKAKVEVPTQTLIDAASCASTRQADFQIATKAAEYGLEVKIAEPSWKEKVRKLRPLLNNKKQAMTDEELLHYVLDQAIEKAAKHGDIGAVVKDPERAHVPAKLRQAIFIKYEGQCAHRDFGSGKRCPATHFLEVDHTVPRALGGLTKASNLQLLCRLHNQRKGAQGPHSAALRFAPA